MSVSIEIISECGIRSENQDNYLCIWPDGCWQMLSKEEPLKGCLTGWRRGDIRLAVADGMGGHNLGREFAEVLTQMLLEVPFHDDIQSMKNSIKALHKTLFAQFYQDSRSPGSTLVIADITEKSQATIGNIGDSRAFMVFPNGQQVQLTHDQTLEDYAYHDGLINQEEYEGLKNNQLFSIAQAIGYGNIRLQASHDNTPPSHKTHDKDLRIRTQGKFKDIFQVSPISQHAKLVLASDGCWNTGDNFTKLTLSILKD